MARSKPKRNDHSLRLACPGTQLLQPVRDRERECDRHVGLARQPCQQAQPLASHIKMRQPRQGRTHLPALATIEQLSRSYFHRYFFNTSNHLFASPCCATNKAILLSCLSIKQLLHWHRAASTVRSIAAENLEYAKDTSLPFNALRSHLCRMSCWISLILLNTGLRMLQFVLMARSRRSSREVSACWQDLRLQGRFPREGQWFLRQGEGVSE